MICASHDLLVDFNKLSHPLSVEKCDKKLPKFIAAKLASTTLDNDLLSGG